MGDGPGVKVERGENNMSQCVGLGQVLGFDEIRKQEISLRWRAIRTISLVDKTRLSIKHTQP